MFPGFFERPDLKQNSFCEGVQTVLNLKLGIATVGYKSVHFFYPGGNELETFHELVMPLFFILVKFIFFFKNKHFAFFQQIFFIFVINCFLMKFMDQLHIYFLLFQIGFQIQNFLFQLSFLLCKDFNLFIVIGNAYVFLFQQRVKSERVWTTMLILINYGLLEEKREFFQLFRPFITNLFY